ncbi:MAG: hypothetical protein Q8Q49_01550 [bacterium]|nr:hypothetical protein [bacterium]
MKTTLKIFMEKTALILFIAILMLLPFPTRANALFENLFTSQSSSSAGPQQSQSNQNVSILNCDEVFRKEIREKDGPDTEKNQSYTVDKATVSKKDNDYCLLRLMSIGSGFEGDFENTVKITYIENTGDTSKFGESRGQKGEAKTVLPLGHCVIEDTFFDHSGTYDAEQMAAMAKYGGLAVKMGTIPVVSNFCGATAIADTQAFSVGKLAVVGGALAAIVGGVAFLLKGKINIKGFSKKKK